MGQLYDLVRLNIFLYPGVRNFRAASFLMPYYAAMQRRQGPLRIALNALSYAVFQLLIAYRARHLASLWNWSPERVREVVSICRRRFADPGDVGLYDITDADEFDHYMRRFEHVGVSRAIANPHTDHDALLTDKLAFARFARECGIAHPRLIAIVTGGKVEMADNAPSEQLIAKPVAGSGGRDVRALDVPDTIVTNREDLGDWLAAQAPLATGRWLVQPRLLPCSALAGIALDALPTIRVTTILNEEDCPEIVTAVLRLASQPGRIVDNVHQGGLIAAIAFESGRLACARNGAGPGDFTHHPVTGAPIAGVLLDQWPRCAAFARNTHAAHFANHVQIGWDIAPTAHGPVIIEANPRPNPRPAQRAMRCGIGETRHGELIRYHLNKAERAGGKRRVLW